MGLIYLTGRRDAIEVPNLKAQRIKNSLLGEGEPKADKSEMVDLGWMMFSFGQIKSIEMTHEKGVEEIDYLRDLTPAEAKNRDAMMKKARANLEAKGLLKPKKIEPDEKYI